MSDITTLINLFDNATYACGMFAGRYTDAIDLYAEEDGRYDQLVQAARKAKANLESYIENGHT